MVDNCGNWYEEQEYSIYPKEKWCLCDYLANAIRKSGYQIRTDMENLIIMILLTIDMNAENDIIAMPDVANNILTLVNESGGFREFDYYI